MLRDRLLQRRWVAYLIVAWGAILAAFPQPAEALPLPPAGAASADLEGARVLLEARTIRARLAALGVSPAEAAAALDRLTPDERAELAARAQELTAGGQGVELLAFAIIVALLVILVLELLGRRVISRP